MVSFCWPLRLRGRARLSSGGGFTLLELLVVLLLVALVAGLAAPAAIRALDAARERGIVSDLEAHLGGLPVRAFAAGQLLSVDAQRLRADLPDLPGDWVLSLPKPLEYGSSGVAAGGDVVLQPPGRPPIRWRVEPVTGQVVRSPS
jgi:prepilin-type N-terminal cleavage/methylation domain-containing protein